MQKVKSCSARGSRVFNWFVDFLPLEFLFIRMQQTYLATANIQIPQTVLSQTMIIAEFKHQVYFISFLKIF